MAAKRPKTMHAQAIGHFLAGRITRDEYQQVVIGDAKVSGHTLFIPSRWRVLWRMIRLTGRRV